MARRSPVRPFLDRIERNHGGPMSEVVTLGETMALVAAPQIGLLRHATDLRLSCGGAESNLAIGVARLGHRATWIGRVGDDEFGVMVSRMLGAEGVAGRVRVDPAAPTGLMVKYRRTGTVTQVLYYRKGSAGSRLDRSDVEPEVIGAARVLHLTGITPALSDTARDAVGYAVDVARAAGVPVSLDLNYRSKLWSPDQAGPVLADLVRRADLVFATEPEARLVVEGTDPAGLARARARAGGDQAGRARCRGVGRRRAAGGAAVPGDRGRSGRGGGRVRGRVPEHPARRGRPRQTAGHRGAGRSVHGDRPRRLGGASAPRRPGAAAGAGRGSAVGPRYPPAGARLVGWSDRSLPGERA